MCSSGIHLPHPINVRSPKLIHIDVYDHNYIPIASDGLVLPTWPLESCYVH